MRICFIISHRYQKPHFYNNSDPEIKYLDTSIFNNIDAYLIHTGVQRNSTDILKTIDIDKSLVLLKDVEDLEVSILEKNIENFNFVIRRTWENKKKTSPDICSNQSVQILDRQLMVDNDILSHKLLGAGNGGYFLFFTTPNKLNILKTKYKNFTKIDISEIGIKSTEI